MSKEKFEEIKVELPAIAEIIKQYPEHLQTEVYKLLITTLLGDNAKFTDAKPNLTQDATPSETSGLPSTSSDENAPRNFVEAFRKFYQEKAPNGKIPEQEFAVVAGYFYAKLMPLENRVVEFSEKELGEAYRLVNRKPPTNLGGTLRNAKANKTLDQIGTGKYKVSLLGEHFVENDLPKKSSR